VTVSRSWQDLSVVAAGLEPGETVVTDGQVRLSPGAKAAIRMPGGAGPGGGEPRAGGETGNGKQGGAPGKAGPGGANRQASAGGTHAAGGGAPVSSDTQR